MYTIYGIAKSRITLNAVDGSPVFRVTLQKETRKGLSLSWKPEGVTHELGSGATWARHRTHRGFRAHLEINWDVALNSTIETWSGGAWGAPASIRTALALAKIFTYAFQAPCLVEPHLDKAFSFLAQPDPGKPFELQDVRGVAHTDLTLVLIATTVGAIPDWGAL